MGLPIEHLQYGGLLYWSEQVREHWQGGSQPFVTLSGKQQAITFAIDCSLECVRIL